MTQESGQPGNTGSDLGRAGRPQHGDNRFRDSLTAILLEFDPGGWDEDPRMDGWADRLRNAITLPDLDASQYDNLITDEINARREILRDYSRTITALTSLRKEALTMLQGAAQAAGAIESLAARVVTDSRIPGEPIEDTCERLRIPRQWVI